MCLNEKVKCPVDCCVDCEFHLQEHYKYFETNTTNFKKYVWLPSECADFIKGVTK